jgi:GNAT superfamily N-acetyltransferase
MSISRHRLKDGSEAMVRPITPSDQERLKASFEQLRADSRYRRFLGAKASLNDRELVYLTEVDHRDHEALVAEQPATGEILGVARFVRSERNSSVAEVGIAVVDHAQRQGLGRVLMDRLASRAREEGVTRFTGVTLVGNAAIRALFRELGPTVATHVGSGTAKLAVNLTTDHAVGGLARAA